MKGDVLVVPTEDLFKILGSKFQGFKPLRGGILPEIEKVACWMERATAEENPDFKQLIPYGVIYTPDKKIFRYRRAKQDKKYPEKRLQGKESIGIGGHIVPSDIADNDSRDDLIISGLLREMDEEIVLHKISALKLLGGINDDSNPVGSVHFGLLFLIRILTENVVIRRGKEIAEGGLKSTTELKEIFNNSTKDVEEWSRIALPHIHA